MVLVMVLVVVVRAMVVLVVMVVAIVVVVVVVVDKSGPQQPLFPTPTTTNITKNITQHEFFLIITVNLKTAITTNTIQPKLLIPCNHQNHHYNPATT